MRIVWIAALAALASGCAGTTVTPIAYAPATQGARAGDESRIDGLRYYEGAHFLIVYSDGKGGLASEVKYLPDLTRKRAIDAYAYLAKNDSTLTFSNGMLSQNKSVIDETVVPKAVITAATKVALADIAAANAALQQDANYLPHPQIYKITFDTTGALKLVRGTVHAKAPAIAVTLQEAEK